MFLVLISLGDAAFDEMRCMKDALSIDDYSDDVVETARRFYEVCFVLPKFHLLLVILFFFSSIFKLF